MEDHVGGRVTCWVVKIKVAERLGERLVGSWARDWEGGRVNWLN